MTAPFPVAADSVIELDQDARLWCWDGPVLPCPDLISRLRDRLPWEQPSIRLFGHWHPIPRLQCWCADAGADYRYSGRQLPRTDWTPELSALRSMTSAMTGKPFNSVLVNLYRDGRDSMGWHADDEPELGPTPWIASWTFGAPRDFVLRRKGETRISHSMRLQHGQLLLMSPAVQHCWQHALPRRTRVAGDRMNLTFRYVQPGSGRSE
ncbi:MAG: alpha-ketoglutarate-dependent dioxygenase AlkB family protein [Alcanivoracaceae bacterium]